MFLVHCVCFIIYAVSCLFFSVSVVRDWFQENLISSRVTVSSTPEWSMYAADINAGVLFFVVLFVSGGFVVGFFLWGEGGCFCLLFGCSFFLFFSCRLGCVTFEQRRGSLSCLKAEENGSSLDTARRRSALDCVEHDLVNCLC